MLTHTFDVREEIIKRMIYIEVRDSRTGYFFLCALRDGLGQGTVVLGIVIGVNWKLRSQICHF